MTRTLLAGELAQAQSWDSDYYVKLEVKNGSGTWIDVGAALGKNWIVNATWGENVETKVMGVTFTLIQQIGTSSLSPLMTASALNRDDLGAYAPLLYIGRAVRASTATMPHGVPLDVSKYREFVTGRIDSVLQADSGGGWAGPITIRCSDLGGWLNDMQIETSGIQYGTTPTGTPLETVLQNVLNANIPAGEPAVTVVKQSTSNFAVTDWAQGDTKVLDALSTLVLDSTGEDIRYRYDAAHVSQLMWFNPDRTRTTVDATFGPRQYVLRQLDIALVNIRNAGELLYGGGRVSATSPSSILAFRRRFFRLPASVMITSAIDAQRVIDAVVNDLSAPPGEAAADCPFLWFVQLYDRYTFQANARQYDSDQTFAVMGYQHTIESGKGSTTLTLTARIVGAFSEWLSRLGVTSSADRAAIRDLQYTLTDTVAVCTFTTGPDVGELWMGYKIVPAPGSDGDFDQVKALVQPLVPLEVRSFTVPRPADKQVTLVQLESRRADGSVSVGDIARLTVTGTPQAPHVELDDAETATTGTQWWKVTERGIPVRAVQVQTQIGSVFTDWGPPTRSAGAASVVRGGFLGSGEYEHDVLLDATRQSWIMPRLILANGAPPIELGPFGFDRDKIPRLVSVIPVGTVVTVTGDSGDTKAVGLYSTTRAWKMEADGASASFDVAIADAAAVAGLGSGASDTFTAKALSDPVAYLSGGTLADTRDIVVGNGAAPSSATWVTVQALAPTVLGDDTLTIKLKASSAPALWIVKIFIANPSTSTAVDRTANVSPALTAPPTVLSSYTYQTGNALTSGGHSMLRTVSVRAELRDGGGVVKASTTVNASWYTGGAL
jgi:hypothetical protein